MNTPTREFLRRPDGSRRRSARQALAVIPNVPGMTFSPGICNIIPKYLLSIL